MMVNSWISCIFFLGILYKAAEVTSSKVDQFPKVLKVARGANVSMFCIFPIFQDAPDVYWWRRGNDSFLEPDSRKRFNVAKGSGSFHVLNASVADSGVYYCKVKYSQNFAGNGSGSRITVYVPPTPLEIVPVEGISTTSLKLECKTAAFYPEQLVTSWRRDGVEILTGVETVKSWSAEGLYEVSSFLEEAQPVPSGVVYTCLVYHVSLLVPANVSYIVQKGHSFSIRLLILARFVLSVLIILAMTGIIVDHVKTTYSEGNERLIISASAARKPTLGKKDACPDIAGKTKNRKI